LQQIFQKCSKIAAKMQQEITVKLQQKFCKEKEKPPYQSQAEAANNILFVFLMTRQRYK
jgi:hypothetical protein